MHVAGRGKKELSMHSSLLLTIRGGNELRSE